MQMWPGHMDDLEGAMEASRVANMLQHVPLAMSLCRVDYANHLKMQSSLSNHMYAPSAFEGILELRKEKSRDAARSRRGKENYEFYELAKLLPLPAAITSQLDKASIIRLTISYLKLRDFSIHGDPPWQRDACSSTKSAAAAAKGSPSQRHSTIALAQDIFETHQGTHILQSVDGFAFALSNDGRFLYISETVSIYLGLSQVEMAGSSIFEYIHSHDHKELAEQLGLNQPKAGSSFYAPLGSDSSDEGSSTPNPPRSTTPSLSERVSVMSPNPSKGYDRCFCIRMKSTLTKRGVHFKSSGYRVVQIVAHLRPQVSFPASPMKQLPPLLGLVGVAIALPPPTITELVIDNDMFVTRLSPQLKITYCEPRISDIMDITSEDFVNKNLYEFCHAEDLQKLHKAHVDLLNKGQVLTDYYRLMNRHGGYVWLQTCATIICNAKNVDEQNIIAINYVLSGVECGDCVMNLDQYRAVTKTELDITDHSDTERTADNEGSISQSGSQQRHSTTASDTVCGLRNAGFKTRSSSCRSTLGDANNDLDGFLPDPSTSTVTPATMLSPPAAADARYGRRRSAGIDDMAADCNGSQKNLAAAAANSRRKADKPRKRKRATSELTTGAAAGADAKTARCDNDEQMMNGEALREHVDDCNGVSGGMDAVDSSTGAGIGGTYGSVLAPTATATAVTSPLPEDLSTVRTEDGSQSPEPLNSPAPSHGADAISHQAWLLADQAAASASAATAVIGDYTSTGVPAASSVHDLEAAMNKHLPVPESTELVDPYVRPHRSAIQWISTGSSSVSAHDATSTLLRSMYPSQRESVIRTNVYNGAVAQRQYYPVSTGDVQSALLTPPGAPESTFISAAAGPRSHLAKTPPSAAAAAAVAAMNHAGGGGAGAGYGLSGYGDAYAMTPPSSVSPQDVLAGAVTQYGLENADGFYPSSSSQHLHSQQRHFTHHHHAQLSAIKPLHYGTGAYEHPMSYHQAAAAAAMAAEYYSSNGGGSLASYSAHYRDAMKHASATW